MALLRVEYSSRVLEMNTSFQVFLPDEGKLSETRVVYLLHGLTDNCTGWTRYTACERYARERGVAIVIPEVQRSFYIDGVYGLKYFTYVSRELPKVCQRMFGFSPRREFNYVMGLSMGGFGALKCMLHNPGRYAGCGSFSGALRMDSEILRNVLKQEELAALVGSDCKAGPANDLLALASAAEKLPPIYLSCGEQDRLYPMSVEFAAHLEKLGAVHRFDHRPGTHSWAFWDQSLRDCFDYLLKQE
jgi:S-formylglutathione hydrolase FrmB